jgi:HK97 family phage prohead protease
LSALTAPRTGVREFGAPLQIAEVKAAGDAWEVAGYVSTFGGAPDHGGDVVLAGAFDATLASGRKTRFLYAHDHEQVLGVPLDLAPDKTGLFGRFKISRTRLGEEVHQLLKDGALDSFSIGYIPEEVEFDETGARLLKQVELLESSIVALPMNDRAVVTRVKQAAGESQALPAHDPAQPFAAYLADVMDAVTTAAARAKALQVRRGAEQRELSDAHVAALRTMYAQLKAALADIGELVAARELARATDAQLALRKELLRRRAQRLGVTPDQAAAALLAGDA